MILDQTQNRSLDQFVANIRHLDKLTRDIPGILNAGTSSRGRLVFMDMNRNSYVSKVGGKFAILDCEKNCEDIRIVGLYPTLDLIFRHKRPYPAMARYLKGYGYEVLINDMMASPNTTGFIVGDKFRLIYN